MSPYTIDPNLDPTYVKPWPFRLLPDIFPPRPIVITGRIFPFSSRKHGAIALRTKVVLPTPGGPFSPNTMPFSV